MTTDSNEKPSGPIELSAGIVESSSKATTRTVEGNHANHLALTTSTQLALQVSGTWTGHGESPYSVVKTTTATVGAETVSESKHNTLTCNPTLYWDDYGSADPNNAATGRATGLTIYGAAINGKTTAPEVTNWTAFSWTLPTNQGPTGSQPADMDLLISNNISGTTYNTAYDGNYRFDQRNNGKLLEFKHALSKITVILTANNGFPGGSGNEAFEDDPQVTLTSNEAGQSTNAEWAYRTSNINVTNGAVSSQQDLSAINMYQATANGHTVSFEALVMPGSQFGSNDNDIIARINADGNIYYVTAANIRDKIAGASKVTEAGKNYIINITVDKTGISNVSATVANWTDVTAENDAPKVIVDASYGTVPNSVATLPFYLVSHRDEFSFYLRKSDETKYGTSQVISTDTYYKEIRRIKYNTTSSKWVMQKYDNGTSEWNDSPLYWPDHQTHYQFRGVWPATGTSTGVVDAVANQPRVKDNNSNQIINVYNTQYEEYSFPSDLMIARPEIYNNSGVIDNTITCNNIDHDHVSLYDTGICATQGNVNLNFRYMMAKVEVNLSTSNTTDQVRLENAVVEITNIHNNGEVNLNTREVTTTGDASSYTLTAVEGYPNRRLNAIVPQTLTMGAARATSNMQFRITITNADSSTDIYYADIQPIPVSVGGNASTTVDKWESGNYYKYNLDITKTNVQVTASLTNWNTVEADHSIWF